MLKMLFLFLMIVFSFKILSFAIKAGWSIIRIIFSILFPAVIIGLVVIGLLYFAIPALIVFAIIYLATRTRNS